MQTMVHKTDKDTEKLSAMLCGSRYSCNHKPPILTLAHYTAHTHT